MRDIALIAIAPLLLYLLASLVTYSPHDPGWSHSGSVTAPLHNVGGTVGAWLADVLLYLCGYVAFLLPVVLGAIAWIALFGMDTDGDGDADLGPALRLVGIVGFLVSATGLLHLRVGAAPRLLGRRRRHPRPAGRALAATAASAGWAATCSCWRCCWCR